MALSEAHRCQNTTRRALDECRELKSNMIDEAQRLRSGNLVQVRLENGLGVDVRRRLVCLVLGLDEQLSEVLTPTVSSKATAKTRHLRNHSRGVGGTVLATRGRL